MSKFIAYRFILFVVFWSLIEKGFSQDEIDNTDEEDENDVSPTYRFFTSPLSWNDAHVQCKSFGMSLATVHAGVADDIQRVLSDFDILDDFWIGGFDNDWDDLSQDNAGYSWVADCRALSGTWTNWKDGEPQNTKDSLCMAVIKGEYRWRSEKCGERRPFLCGPAADTITLAENKSDVMIVEASLNPPNPTTSNEPEASCSNSTTTSPAPQETTTTTPATTTTTTTATTTPTPTSAPTSASTQAPTSSSITTASTPTPDNDTDTDTIKALILDVSQLSSTRRKKESAPDYRVSSAVIGTTQIFFVMCVYALIFASDLLRVYQDIRYGPHYVKRRQKQKKTKNG